MNQSNVNYAQIQPYPQQLSYNAVKIDVHNPKVMDGQPCPMSVPYQQAPQQGVPQQQSAYNMPYNPYYNYNQTNTLPNYNSQATVYPQQACTCTCPIHQGYQNPAAQTPVQTPPQAPVQQTAQTPVQTPPQAPVQQVQQTPQPVDAPQNVTPQPAVIPTPVHVVPAPVQQVINNGIPATQVINQNPATQTQPEQKIINPAPADVNKTTEVQNNVDTKAPETSMPSVDITPVLKGLQSNNMAEQADALNKIGEAGDNPEQLKHYLEPAVLDSLLGILHADTKGLEGPTKEQEAARDKWMKEKDLPKNEKTITPQEEQLAMTLAPKELADKNKQFAMYSISILQKALADEIEKTNGEKISIEKLPAIDHIVNVLKSNPNPVLRASAIVALAHLNKEDYKPVLTDIFKLAQKDEDPNVQQVASEALDRINISEAPKK